MIVAAFATEAGMRKAAAEIRRGDPGFVETYMAMEPREAEDDGAGDGHMAGGSILPAVMLFGGIVGGLGGFLMQAYATTISYPQNIGGRPDLSWPSYVPTTFELAVLGAVVAGMAGYLLLARMPRLYDPVDEAECMRTAMLGFYVLVARPTDSARAHRVLARHAPIGIEEVAE
ncbi:conserved hypothetical protein [Gluconacetobacter diazotrophicus PA1 5]|uniref:Putative membrane protein n=1 Tax=Gluconacetobacter diazotrophicus (strain ATCC 49037 / DSM 5601 / CCUG 37298 / CIP 103539 / LMG 7603 / PAl5) TaxID=272568 RepID=A9HP99_GLUDA|nr:DUF3341 domain-containing protein [Gluconacetobacter diazotrophicus]ACI50623.1 conserved hypothetical protein [Gluconacetobacter diazotrophicus PA1 5]TWB09455.1 uncharacterized protein DUF3341 [Gluconacetobacter diazotrophicus]CAP56561.1 putative membrane protein [Gluconacetobacter diazotrophicus PA1 5]